MATLSGSDIENALKVQWVQEFTTLETRHKVTLFGAVQLQVKQLEDLQERIQRKVATVMQVSISRNNIQSDLFHLKGKITRMEKDKKLQQNELGTSPNAFESFKGIVAILEKAVQTLNTALPQVEEDEKVQRNLEGQRLFTLIAVGIVGFFLMRSYLNH